MDKFREGFTINEKTRNAFASYGLEILKFSVLLDPLCPDSIDWYLTEVCGFPTDGEILAISPEGVTLEDIRAEMTGCEGNP